jgi:hypothetical protein
MVILVWLLLCVLALSLEFSMQVLSQVGLLQWARDNE